VDWILRQLIKSSHREGLAWLWDDAAIEGIAVPGVRSNTPIRLAHFNLIGPGAAATAGAVLQGLLKVGDQISAQV
jgi:hypothetical protein